MAFCDANLINQKILTKNLFLVLFALGKLLYIIASTGSMVARNQDQFCIVEILK